MAKYSLDCTFSISFFWKRNSHFFLEESHHPFWSTISLLRSFSSTNLCIGFCPSFFNLSFSLVWSRDDLTHSDDRLSTHVPPHYSLVANLVEQSGTVVKISASPTNSPPHQNAYDGYTHRTSIFATQRSLRFDRPHLTFTGAWLHVPSQAGLKKLSRRQSRPINADLLTMFSSSLVEDLEVGNISLFCKLFKTTNYSVNFLKAVWTVINSSFYTMPSL